MREDNSFQEIDKAPICFSKRDNLSTEHFIELIEKRAEDCYAWERKCRAQGNHKDAERMGKPRSCRRYLSQYEN